MKYYILLLFMITCTVTAFSQVATVESPDKSIRAGLHASENGETGNWFISVDYFDHGEVCHVVPEILLGIKRSDQDFSEDLKLAEADKPKLINEQYTAVHGKRSLCSNAANEIKVVFENPHQSKLNLIIRAYNDGLAFRYEFPEKEGTYVVNDELTSYLVPETTKRWLEKWNPANELLYHPMNDGNTQQEWCYPALFNVPGSNCWYLLHEADVNREYCGTKLSNEREKSRYKLTFPDPRDGNGMGESQPTISLPWKSPWRIVIIGTLADIVESTLVNDVSTPSVVAGTEWIRPGIASWNYWSHNHGTKDFQVVCDFADLAASMDWPYTLIDWEWDAMGNGGDLRDAVKYIHSLGIIPLMWYNSGGKHTRVPATPRDRMLTHENRVEEFTKLRKMGVAGVKVDFFESEKQDMIKYYLDILEDAASYEMMVYFHGCLVPRGWSRTYPNLMTYEGVRGAEWYNNGPELTTTAPEHNTTLPFTRNVVGAMDYTPVTFTNSQYPHITSYGHELALSVVFESGIQHMADRPEGYFNLPDAARTFLRNVPNAWDDTKLLDGYPGQSIVIARKKGDDWYVGGLNGTNREKTQNLEFDFLPEGVKYKLTLIADGAYDTVFNTTYQVVDHSDSVEVKMLRRGGFAAALEPVL